MRSPLLTILTLSLAACGVDSGGVDVMSSPEVLFRWDAAYNELDDGISAVIPLDVLVYDVESGAPVGDVAVAWHSDSVRFALPDAVLSTTTLCDSCVWNPYRDDLLELEQGGDVVPLDTRTDADGVARVYALVDSIGETDAYGEFAAPIVLVKVADREFTIELVPR